MANKRRDIINHLIKINPTVKKFEKEFKALEKIRTELDNLGDDQKQISDELLYEIWKFYRAFKFKEFILKYHERICIEKDTIETNVNKTVEMLDEAFLWTITNWSDGNKQKYEQRFYSKKVLETLLDINKLDKLPIYLQNEIIELLNEYIGENKLPKIISYPNDDEKRKNERNKTSREKILSSKNVKLIDLVSGIELNRINVETIKSLIGRISEQTKSGMRIDHVLTRQSIKEYVELLCCDLQKREDVEERIKIIDTAIDNLLPLMFGCVLEKEEHDSLDKGVDVKRAIANRNSIFAHYENNICLYDFDKLLRTDKIDECLLIEYSGVNIDQPYNYLDIEGHKFIWQDKTWVEPK